MEPAIEFFDSLLKQQLPTLSTRLHEYHSIPTTSYLTPWLLTLFARSLPLRTTCRIWDRVLADGEAELFRTAIALLTLLSPALMLAGFEETLQLLQHLPLSETHLDEAKLLEAIAKVELPMAEYERLLSRCLLGGL